MESFLIILSLIIPFSLVVILLLLDFPSKRRQSAIKKYFTKRGEENVRVKQSSAVSFQDKIFLKKLDEIFGSRADSHHSIIGYSFHKIRAYYRVTSTQGKIVEVVVLQYNLPFAPLHIYLDREI